MRFSAMILSTALFGGVQAQNFITGAEYNATCEAWRVVPDADTTKLIMTAKCSGGDPNVNGGMVCSALDLTPCFYTEYGWLIAHEPNEEPLLHKRNLPQDHGHPNEAWDDFLDHGIDDSFTSEPAEPNRAPVPAAGRNEDEDDEGRDEQHEDAPQTSNANSTITSRAPRRLGFTSQDRQLKERRRMIIQENRPRANIEHWFPAPIHKAQFDNKPDGTHKIDTVMSYSSSDPDKNQMPEGYYDFRIQMANIIGNEGGILYCPGTKDLYVQGEHVMGVAINC